MVGYAVANPPYDRYSYSPWFVKGFFETNHRGHRGLRGREKEVFMFRMGIEIRSNQLSLLTIPASFSIRSFD